MKAVIDYHHITEVNKEQTLIYFHNEWHEILEDQDGSLYFMFDGNSIYFEIAQ